MSVEGYWKVLKGALDRTCRWAESPVRQRETWWQNDVYKSVCEKCKLWKE